MEKNSFPGRSWSQVVIAAGGTGGHIFPAQALAIELMQKEERIEIIFMSARLRENLYFRKEAFKFREISSATPFRKSPLAILKSFGSLFKGMFQSLAYFIKKRPKLVIGFGSFYSFPVIFAAKVLFIPIVLFEADVHPGRVNRLFCRFADLTAVQFEKTATFLKGKTVCVGMPLFKKEGEVQREKAREYFGLKKELFTFLVFGGSQGAQAINRFFCESLERLVKKGWNFQVIHLVGDPNRAEKLKEVYRTHKIPACVKPFEEKMHLAWSATDLSISRAGAGTLAELLEFTIPGILIPFPFASENHQEKNARFMSEEIKGGVLLREANLSSDQLVKVIEDLLSSSQKKLEEMKRALALFKQNERKIDFASLIFEKLR